MLALKQQVWTSEKQFFFFPRQTKQTPGVLFVLAESKDSQRRGGIYLLHYIREIFYGKREWQKWLREHDFPAIFHVYCLPFSVFFCLREKAWTKNITKIFHFKTADCKRQVDICRLP